jgi:hypothetical protein
MENGARAQNVAYSILFSKLICNFYREEVVAQHFGLLLQLPTENNRPTNLVALKGAKDASSDRSYKCERRHVCIVGMVLKNQTLLCRLMRRNAISNICFQDKVFGTGLPAGHFDFQKKQFWNILEGLGMETVCIFT